MSADEERVMVGERFRDREIERASRDRTTLNLKALISASFPCWDICV